MLAHVLQQLGHHEVRDSLDRLRRPRLRQIHRHLHRHHAPRRHRRQRRVQPPVRQYRRMDPAREVPQLLERELHLPVGLVDHRRRALRVLQQFLLRQAQPHRQRHQPGLRPVVQVPLDAPQVGRRGVDDHAPVGFQLRDPPLQVVGRRQESPYQRPVRVRQQTHQIRQHRPQHEQPGQGYREGEDPPRQPDELVQHRPPADRILDARPQPGEESAGPLRTGDRGRLLHPYAQQPAGACPVQPSQLPRQIETASEQRKSDRGHGKTARPGNHDNCVNETDDRHRQIAHQKGDLLPRHGAEHGAYGGRSIVVGDGMARGHAPQPVKRAPLMPWGGRGAVNGG